MQFLFCLFNREVIRDRLVIWALTGLFLGIIQGAILGDFRHYLFILALFWLERPECIGNSLFFLLLS